MRRREFLKRSATVLLVAPVWRTPLAWTANAGAPANQRITVGLIGIGAMGSGHLRRLAGDPGFQLVAVCDVDPVRREQAKSTVEAMYAAERAKGTYQGCVAYRDYRELLARPDVDAVLIATPDHWHALQAIEAAKAGKDVYCEKPVSMTIQEGRRIVAIMRRYGRVFQTGTQYRSITAIRQVCRFVRRGGLGRIKSVFTLINPLESFMRADRFKPYTEVLSLATCGRSYVPLEFPLPAEPVPEGMDWDLWVGPAAWHPYNRLYHINPSPGVVPWSFCEAFGVTSSTWFLSHAADVIQWALGMETSGPVEIIHPSSGQFPTLTCRYANGTLLHLVDHWGMVKDLYHAVPATARLAGNFGGVFVGERGWLTSMTTGGPIEGSPEELFKEMGMNSREVNIGANNHHANWLECIHTRQAPSAEEEIGHRSASLGHLVHIACWTGQSLAWDPGREEFSGNDTANRLRARAMRAPWRM
jgi:hypothetical protein